MIQRNIDLDFSTGVRTLMRQDPDIIMIGEIRDMETAEMAIQAALTGHLVLSTLHTNDAPSAVTRMLDIGVPPYLLQSSILGVMAQRLVRTLCPHCKQGYMGRMGLYEMFTFTDKVRKLVNASCDISELRQQTLKDGLKPLRLSGASKVAAGVTTIEEVMRVAPPPLAL